MCACARARSCVRVCVYDVCMYLCVCVCVPQSNENKPNETLHAYSFLSFKRTHPIVRKHILWICVYIYGKKDSSIVVSPVHRHCSHHMTTKQEGETPHPLHSLCPDNTFPRWDLRLTHPRSPTRPTRRPGRVRQFFLKGYVAC